MPRARSDSSARRRSVMSVNASTPVVVKMMCHEGPRTGSMIGFTKDMGFAVALVLKLEELAGVAVNVGTGLQVGLLLGVFVAAAASLSHRLFAGHGYRVWLLEVGNDIAAVVVMGLILGAWR